MNFLLRSTSPVSRVLPTVPEVEPVKDEIPIHRRTTTLEGLIAEDPISKSSSEDGGRSSDGIGDVRRAPVDSNQVPMSNHSDVAEDEGWITIPYRNLPDDWSDASNIHQLRSLDRSFVFPGEQVRLLVCLSASKQDTEVITPFKVAGVISRNDNKQMENSTTKSNSMSVKGVEGSMNNTCEATSLEENGETKSTSNISVEEEDVISATESIHHMEDHKHQTETLLERFRNSNFFVRVAESDEPLWSKRHVLDASSSNLLNVVIDRGGFEGNTSGGVARNSVKVYSLSNGDVVVLLQVNVAINNIKDPILEVLQFEKYEAPNATSENLNGSQLNHEDPYRKLLNWLLPLDRTLPPRPLSPPLNSSSTLGGVTQRSISASTSSQIFSFGNFRSYSMPSLPQVNVPPSHSKSSFGLEDYDRFLQEKAMSRDMGNIGLLSFRGVSLVPERFSVHCGLEGIYLPGRRWHKKLEIVQPIEIHSFPAECITEDLLCVQVKNVSPAHSPDIVIYLDAIAIVFEESSQSGLPISLPIASIETGNDHNLPNLSLRRGEEHSFILKPAMTVGRVLSGHGENRSVHSHQKIYPSTSNRHPTSRVSDAKKSFPSATDQYAILVSCRCNYTESKLFFKQQTSWRPHVERDLMISVAPELSEQTDGRISQLPIQVLNLQASNLTSEDLTLTILAPVESNASTFVVPLNSASIAPKSPFGFFEYTKSPNGLQKLGSVPVETENRKETNEKRSLSLGQRASATSDVVSSSDLGFSHLWLQSTVPLGCVPAGSSATAKLELLPLTDGIITLSTLKVAVKEKGLTYRPEQPLKIRATSSVSTGIA